MTECEKYRDDMSAMLDGELSREGMQALHEHVKHCPACAALLKDYVAVGRLFPAEEPVPDVLHKNVMAGVRQVKRERRKRMLVHLLPVAACLVLIVGIAAAIPAIVSNKSADKAATESVVTTTESAAETPAEAPAAGRTEQKSAALDTKLETAAQAEPEMAEEADDRAGASYAYRGEDVDYRVLFSVSGLTREFLANEFPEGVPMPDMTGVAYTDIGGGVYRTYVPYKWYDAILAYANGYAAGFDTAYKDENATMMILELRP